MNQQSFAGIGVRIDSILPTVADAPYAPGHSGPGCAAEPARDSRSARVVAPDEAASHLLFRRGHGPRGMDECIRHLRQFRHMEADVSAVGIEAFRLSHRVENPKPGLRIAAGRCAPLPAAVIRRQIIIQQPSRKIALAARQSIPRSFTRNEATIMRRRLCMQPLAFSSRMAASTMG